MGSKTEAGAQGLWDSLPACYLDAQCYTDLRWAYQAVVFGAKHHRRGKGTQPIERFNGTLRQRVSRLVRKTLPFSKKLDNPILDQPYRGHLALYPSLQPIMTALELPCPTIACINGANRRARVASWRFRGTAKLP